MAYIKYSQGNRVSYDAEKWVVETIEDLKVIPCNKFASTAYVIDTKENYILNSQHMWKPMSSINSGDIPSCNHVDELTIWGDIADDGTIITSEE